MMTQLRIQLLGDIAVHQHGVNLLPGRRYTRATALLAYLLMRRGKRLSREQLASTFWPDSNNMQARTNLRGALIDLREHVPQLADCLEDHQPYLSWRMDCKHTVDVFEFESLLERAEAIVSVDASAAIAALRQSVSIYAGELLPGFYDEWVLDERNRLHTAYLNALLWLAELLETSGQIRDAIRYAEMLLRADRLRENSHLLLMRLHIAVGDRAQALKVYADCTRLLVEELGVEPGPAIQSLHRRLLQEPVAAGVLMQPAAPAGALVGRAAEWRQLLDGWERAMTGDTQIIMLMGEPGIGKTRLMQELRRHCADAGGLVLAATCPQARDPVAYVAPALWLALPELTARLAHLDEEYLAYLQLLLPELRQRYPHVHPPTALTPHWQRLHLHQALSTLFAGGGEPTLLFLDDAQWCDAASVEWLQHLVATQPQAHLLVVMSIRTGETGAPSLASMRTELVARGRLQMIELMRLSYTETEQLVGQHVTPPPAATVLERIYRTSAGIPYIVVELARTLMQTTDTVDAPDRVEVAHLLPANISALVLHRLAGLSSSAQRTLDCAAVIGVRFAGNVLHQVVHLPEDEYLQALDELWRSALIRVVGDDDYEFDHELVRTVLYESLSVVRRRQLHRLAAETMAALYVDDLSSFGEQIAEHYERGGRPLEAAQTLLLMAQSHSGALVLETAQAHIARALALLERAPHTSAAATQAFLCWLHLGAILARHRRYDDDQMRRAFTQAHRLSKQLPDLHLRFWALRGLWGVEWGAVQLESALDIAQELLGMASGLEDDALRAEAHWAQGATLFYLGRFPEAVAMLQAAATFNGAGSVRSDSLPRLYAPATAARCYLALIELLCGDPDQGLRAIHKLIASAERHADAYTYAFVLAHLGIAHYLVRDVDAVFAAAERLVALSIQHSYGNMLAIAERLQSWAFALHEDGAAEVDLLRQMVLDQVGVTAEVAAPLFVVALTEALTFHGRHAEALALIDVGLAAVQRQHFVIGEIELHRLRGELLLRSDHDLQAGENELERALLMAQRQGVRLYALRSLTSLCRVLTQHGRREDAIARLRSALTEFPAASSLLDVQTARTLLHELSTDRR